MKSKLRALKLILEAINIPAEIDTVEDRKKVQKAIYLGQENGVNLGFHFSWYKMGPYSPELTKDYYELSEELSQGDHEYTENELAPVVNEKLQAVKSIIKTPGDVSLSQDDWMELLASHLYLRKMNDFDKTKEILRKEKSNLVPYIEKAETKLKESGFLNT